MVTVIADDLSVCVDCALIITNAEINDGTNRGEEIALAQVALWGDDATGLVLSAMDDEPFHSKYPCEGCGNPDEGDRMKAAVLR